MKRTIARLFGIETPNPTAELDRRAAVEVLTAVAISAQERVRRLRVIFDVPAPSRGRKKIAKEILKARMSASNKLRYDRLKAEGRCVVCAGPNAQAPKARCENCLTRRKNAPSKPR